MLGLIAAPRTPGGDDFRLDDLRDRRAGADWYDDEEHEAYGLGP